MLCGSSVLASSWDQHVLDQQRGSFVMPIYKQKDFQSCQGLELSLASILCLQPPGYSVAAGSREKTLKHPGKFGDAARMEAAWVEQLCSPCVAELYKNGLRLLLSHPDCERKVLSLNLSFVSPDHVLPAIKTIEAKIEQGSPSPVQSKNFLLSVAQGIFGRCSCA